MTSHTAAFYTKRNLNATQESNTEKVPFSYGLIGIRYFYSDCANYSYTLDKEKYVINKYLGIYGIFGRIFQELEKKSQNTFV